MQLLSLRSMGMSKFTHCKQRTIELSSALQHELHFFVDKFDYVAILLSSEYTAYYGLNNISLLLCSDASPSTPYSRRRPTLEALPALSTRNRTDRRSLSLHAFVFVLYFESDFFF